MVTHPFAKEESKVVKQDINLFLDVAGGLIGRLADWNNALAPKICLRSSTKPA
jgi:hypothetical protein